MSVTILSLIRGFRKPDGILCHYPVFSIDETRFFPSTLLSIDEELLSSCFLKFAMACFNREKSNPVNPVMSPIHAPTDILKLLPPCKFMVAQIDALRDQSFHMAYRLLKNGCDAEVIVMEDFIHGFCNMDMPQFGVNEYKRGTELTTSLFRQLFISVDKASSSSIGPTSEVKGTSPPQGILDQEFEVVDHVDS